MRSPGVPPTRGLSCYTAGLFGYLEVEWDAAAVLARSVRLGVRVDLPDGRLAFSHHDPPLDLLPDGSRLVYAGAASADAALTGLAGELDGHGRALAVVDAARLPWSVAAGGPPQPHWMLIDGTTADGWHVVDGFTALLPGGEQAPYGGWLRTAALRDAMTLPGRWEPEQELRNRLAFGSPVQVPAGALWLRRGPAGVGQVAGRNGRWLLGDARALPFLASYLTGAGAGPVRHLVDVWAAAGHRSFAHRWRLARGPGPSERRALDVALSRWEGLPQVLRFALESACRGRPRPTLVRTALDALLRAEQELAEVS